VYSISDLPMDKVFSLRAEGAQPSAGGTSVPKMAGPRAPNTLRNAEFVAASYAPMLPRVLPPN